MVKVIAPYNKPWVSRGD